MAVASEIREGKVRAECLQNRVVIFDEIVNAGGQVEKQPDDDDWSEGCAELGSAKGLDRK